MGLKLSNSKLLWNFSYPLLCDQFNLEYNFDEDFSSLVFWKDFLPDLPQFASDSIRVAGLAYYADENPSYTNKLYVKSLYYREAVQLGRSLCLAKRCQISDEENSLDDSAIDTAGLYFLYHTLKADCFNCWPRVRLAFDKEMVLSIEEKSPAHLFPDATTRSFQRLWKMTYQIILNNKDLAS